MKVLVTLDFVDGARSKTSEVYLDVIDTSFMRMTLMQQGVCGITITRCDRLAKVAQQLKGDEHE